MSSLTATTNPEISYFAGLPLTPVILAKSSNKGNMSFVEWGCTERERAFDNCNAFRASPFL